MDFDDVDESHIECNVKRLYGYVPEGADNVAVAQDILDPAVFSLILAVSRHGIIYWELIEKKTSKVNSSLFCEYFVRLRQRLSPVAIVMMDNASIHKTVEARRLYRESPQQVIFVAPFSPDLSLVELIFNVIKQRLKKYAFNSINLQRIVTKIVDEINEDCCNNIFKYVEKIWEKVKNGDDFVA